MMINCQDRMEDIFKNGFVSGNDGKIYPLRSNIDRNEGEFLRTIIREHQCRKTLEVGCAMGISSLFICSALEGQDGASHTIIDPNQTTDWHSLGITQLDRAKVDYYRLVEEPSEYALPRLAKQGEKYDFCFIDGWHTFDHTLLVFSILTACWMLAALSPSTTSAGRASRKSSGISAIIQTTN